MLIVLVVEYGCVGIMKCGIAMKLLNQVNILPFLLIKRVVSLGSYLLFMGTIGDQVERLYG